MDYIWSAFLIIGILFGIFTGNLTAVNDAVLSSGREAIELCITTAGVLALWSGLMEIAKVSGIVDAAVKTIRPLIRFLFPKLPENHQAAEHISMNFIANFLGLNWGATPAGLRAMDALCSLEKERGNPPQRASDEMCTFLIINISSLQLLPVNIIAYRQQYGSVHPTAIVGPAIAATFISTLTAIIFCKLKNRKP